MHTSFNTMHPAVIREVLAARLYSNWSAAHPGDSQPPTSGSDLTCLSWLTTIPASAPPPQSHNEPSSQIEVVVPSPQASPLSSGSGDVVDYQVNPHVKPPHSYSTLICMALRESDKGKMTLAAIYSWITENFPYYRSADPSWQNSIRHNLSLNKSFEKVPRRKDEPGKGGFWRINPEFEDKKRRGSYIAPITLAPPTKRARESDDVGSVRPSKVKVKREPGMNAALDDGFEFSWNSILGQEIEIGGVRIKTEDILDESAASPITDLTPPPSEESSNADDIAFEELFNSADFSEALDFSLNKDEVRESGLHTPPPGSPVQSHPWAQDKVELENAISCLDNDYGNFIDLDNLPTSSVTTDELFCTSAASMVVS